MFGTRAEIATRPRDVVGEQRARRWQPTNMRGDSTAPDQGSLPFDHNGHVHTRTTYSVCMYICMSPRKESQVDLLCPLLVVRRRQPGRIMQPITHIDTYPAIGRRVCMYLSAALLVGMCTGRSQRYFFTYLYVGMYICMHMHLLLVLGAKTN